MQRYTHFCKELKWKEAPTGQGKDKYSGNYTFIIERSNRYCTQINYVMK